ncbi:MULTISPECIES: hypothetical protein [Streptomyces]|uniref:hypothetical protein n=1 Tax=Streptomyces TaxID=1883 RepID=UPI0018727E77|nr:MULTISPECIES: hypothetical protein [Streptomyces]
MPERSASCEIRQAVAPPPPRTTDATEQQLRDITAAALGEVYCRDNGRRSHGQLAS